MKSSRSLLRWASLATFLLLLFAVSPATAQRGRTGGERKSETEEKKPTPPARESRREPEAQPAPRRSREQPPSTPEPRREPETRTPQREPQTQPTPAPRDAGRGQTRSPETRQRERERNETPRGAQRTQPEKPRQAERGRDADRSGNAGRSGDTGRNGRATDANNGRTAERGRSATDTGQRVSGDRQGRVVGSGGRSTGSRVDRNPRPNRGHRDRYKWYRVPPVPHGGYHYRPAAPIIHLDFEWPWEYRHRRAWSPRYRYRQVLHIESGYGYDRWTSRLEVRTTYRQRVRSASRNRAELDLDIEGVEIYQDGQYLGRVTRIPNDLGRVRATVHRNGRISFDRDVFVVGSREVGFEIIATRHYDGYFLSHWRRDDRFEVGRLNLRRNRVERVRNSRLLDYDGYGGYAPISLLPEDERWLGDYGPYAVSTYAYDDDFYDDYGYDDGYYYGYESGVRPRNGLAPRGESAGTSPLLQGNSDDTYETVNGAHIRLRREAEIQRIE